ncbi:SOS response-associated peptidase family protein [Pokkaliibacter sp. MBI-7]|uniref:SOS response-associated peptidase n=1 Tax=Pokkaliibacter sp. MBI-7 TaxID=3040600 RepID=UPI0024475676|nr:SOS response-associated peptidase family protein [Pokkaliibacter sp. MBI-7]MDH2431211.1 SOS response-associated peptidase family protein [Pokkaliibacter sp. MBI-7]
MTGRIVQVEALQQGWDLQGTAPRPLTASYNLSPYQWLALQRQPDLLEPAHWGLAPSWIKRLNEAPYTARAEQLLTNAMFKRPLARQRAVLPVDGVYDWISASGRRWPIYISSPEHTLMNIAALWEVYQLGDMRFLTCALISVPSNPFLSAFLTRMPALLDQQQTAQWLSTDTTDTDAIKLLQPWSGVLQTWQVTAEMNSPQFQGSDCIKPVGKVFKG